MENNKNVVSNVLSGFSFLLTAVQTNDIMQLVMLILSILSVLVSISFTLYKWYREASKDGKIDKSEIDEGIDIIKQGLEDISKEVENYDNQGNKRKD